MRTRVWNLVSFLEEGLIWDRRRRSRVKEGKPHLWKMFPSPARSSPGLLRFFPVPRLHSSKAFQKVYSVHTLQLLNSNFRNCLQGLVLDENKESCMVAFIAALFLTFYYRKCNEHTKGTWPEKQNPMCLFPRSNCPAPSCPLVYWSKSQIPCYFIHQKFRIHL